MNKMRKSLLLPLLAVVIAVGSAFAGQVKTVEEVPWVPGYISTNKPCDTQVHCGPDGIPGCLAPNGQTAYAKQSPTMCTIPLFRLY